MEKVAFVGSPGLISNSKSVGSSLPNQVISSPAATSDRAGFRQALGNDRVHPLGRASKFLGILAALPAGVS
jgi:hypothetical protein